MVQSILWFLFLLAVLSVPVLTPAADPYEVFSVLRVQKKPTPDFSLPQVGGKTVKLSDYKGKVLLLGFFKTF